MNARLLLATGLMTSAALACASPLKVAEVLATPHCSERAVRVTAYLEASRHGSWLVDTIGSRKAIQLDFDPASKSRAIESLKNYIWRPQDYLNKTFHATFRGRLRCPPPDGKIVSLRVDDIEDIRISAIVGAEN